jgi:hypothetical protein
MNLESILVAIEVTGTIAFALSGLIESTRKRMDVIGVLSVTFASAFGGGTVRDVLLDRRPLFWVTTFPTPCAPSSAARSFSRSTRWARCRNCPRWRESAPRPASGCSPWPADGASLPGPPGDAG